MQHCTDHHVVLDGKPEKRPDQLKGAADPAPADLVRPTAIDPCTVETDAAAVRRDHARNHVEQRRLPRPVWTDDCEDGSLRDAKAYVVNGKEPAKSLADPLHFEEVVHLYDLLNRSLAASHGQTPPGSTMMIRSRATP